MVLRFAKLHWKVIGLVCVTGILLLFGLALGLGTESSAWVILFSIIACAIFVGCFFLITKARHRFGIEKVFLLILLVFGLTYTAVFPPHAVPDEIFHYQGTYKLSNQLMGYHDEDMSMTIRQVDRDLVSGSFPRVTATRYNTVAESIVQLAGDSEEIVVQTQAAFTLSDNLRQLRIFAALGVTLARLLGLGAFLTFYLGRLFNLLFFAVLAYFAVKITPKGKMAFMAIALLPMTLHVVSSLSPDAGTFGLALLTTALFLKAIYSEEKLSKRLIVGILVFSAILAPSKVVYAVVILLALLIPSKSFSSKKMEVLLKASFIIVPFVVLVLLNLPTMLFAAAGATQAPGGGLEFQRGEAVGILRSTSDALANPFGTLLFFLKTLDLRGGYYFDTMIGNSLGWFQGELLAPFYLLSAFTILLLLAFLKNPKDTDDVPWSHKTVYLGAAIIGVFAVLMSQYLFHTFITDFVIEGVQGRYFIPLLPLIALVLKNRVLVLTKDLDNYLLIAFCFFNLFYMLRTFAIASTLLA